MSVGTKRSYEVSQFRDPRAELTRLQRQTVVMADAEEAALRRLAFPEEGRVLDVGCGPGFVAARVGAARPKVTIVGVDSDAEVLRRVPPGIETVEADAHALPFTTGEFVGAYARLVLRHLARPDVAVAEMFRVIAPGGRILVLDSDDGALVLDPWPAGFAGVLAAKQETARRRGGNPFIGRRLAALLENAGFQDLVAAPLCVDSITIGAAAFAHVVLSPVADAIDEDLMPREDVARAARAVGEWATGHQSFGMTTAVAIGARKPP